jgi:hypothetical protein
VLQTVLARLAHSFKFKAHQIAIIVSSGLPHPTQQVPILKKRLNGHTNCRGLLHMTGLAALPSENISQRFFQGKKPSAEDITSRFLMNMKGINIFFTVPITVM